MQKALEKQAQELSRELEHHQNIEKLLDENLDPELVASHLGLLKKDTIHVGGLPYKVNENDLRELFNDCGVIKDINIP